MTAGSSTGRRVDRCAGLCAPDHAPQTHARSPTPAETARPRYAREPPEAGLGAASLRPRRAAGGYQVAVPRSQSNRSGRRFELVPPDEPGVAAEAAKDIHDLHVGIDRARALQHDHVDRPVPKHTLGKRSASRAAPSRSSPNDIFPVLLAVDALLDTWAGTPTTWTLSRTSRVTTAPPDHRRRPHVDVIEDDRPHAQVGPGADRARAGDVRSAESRRTLQSPCGGRPALRGSRGRVDRASSTHPRPHRRSRSSPPDHRRPRHACGGMDECREAESERRDLIDEAATMRRQARTCNVVLGEVSTSSTSARAARQAAPAALRLHVLHEPSDAQAGTSLARSAISSASVLVPRTRSEASGTGYQPATDRDHLAHLLVGEGDVHGQRDRPAPERLDVRRGWLGNIGYR